MGLAHIWVAEVWMRQTSSRSVGTSVIYQHHHHNANVKSLRNLCVETGLGTGRDKHWTFTQVTCALCETKSQCKVILNYTFPKK